MQTSMNTPPISPKKRIESFDAETLLFEKIEEALGKPRESLAEFLIQILPQSTKNPLHGQGLRYQALQRFEGQSGYQIFSNRVPNLKKDILLSEIRFGATLTGEFVVQTRFLNDQDLWTQKDFHYHSKGALASHSIPAVFQFFPEKNFEPNCPILNHIYNILAVDFSESAAMTTPVKTERTYTLQKFLRQFSKEQPKAFSFSKGHQDASLVSLRAQIAEIEKDPIYTWKERAQWIKTLKSDRKEMIRVKERAHGVIKPFLGFHLFKEDVNDFFIRFQQRPINNFFGTLDRIFFDPIRWFFKVVRGNMGYSVALAIYSPFTFFFITQPMNPHAMWAVGKVRSAYIETTESIKSVMGVGVGVLQPKASEASTEAGESKSVTSPRGSNAAPSAPTQNNFTSLPFPTTATHSTSLNDQTWEDRMSHFKALQIQYEGNMEIAPRLGRLEQMETQFNWPLIIESTWFETERYLSQIHRVIDFPDLYTQDIRNYLSEEKKRVESFQLYLWDKNIRFFLDHPFTMMDRSKEQTQMDAYVGRAFVNLDHMTQTLMKRYQGLPLPKGFEEIQKVADHFKQEYKNEGNLFTRLKKNSKVFQQKDPLESKEMRAYMKRQWEVLYLLQNKAQEAANFGLQTYIWSVRNAVYLMQSYYSAKREELSQMLPIFQTQHSFTPMGIKGSIQQFDHQYESLYHMMVMEFGSIAKELSESLPGDLEASQRKELIEMMKKSLESRESILKAKNLI